MGVELGPMKAMLDVIHPSSPTDIVNATRYGLRMGESSIGAREAFIEKQLPVILALSGNAVEEINAFNKGRPPKLKSRLF